MDLKKKCIRTIVIVVDLIDMAITIILDQEEENDLKFICSCRNFDVKLNFIDKENCIIFMKKNIYQ